jgi:hypothetical protein
MPREPAWPAAHVQRANVFAGSLRAQKTLSAPASAATREDELIQRQLFCVASSVSSAGALGDTVLYRFRRRDAVLEVGYFVYWTTERPWGDNDLTRRIYPALAIDAFYSHFLFVLPGARRLIYGPGDIEGILVRYRIEEDRLVPMSGVADDEFHRHVELERADLAASDGRVIALTETWSHQLGAKRAAARTKDSEQRCFSGTTLAPLSSEVADTFRLGDEHAPRRAKPAWRAVMN